MGIPFPSPPPQVLLLYLQVISLANTNSAVTSLLIRSVLENGHLHALKCWPTSDIFFHECLIGWSLVWLNRVLNPHYSPWPRFSLHLLLDYYGKHHHTACHSEPYSNFCLLFGFLCRSSNSIYIQILLFFLVCFCILTLIQGCFLSTNEVQILILTFIKLCLCYFNVSFCSLNTVLLNHL